MKCKASDQTELSNTHVNLTNVIADDVKHDEHASGMASLNKRLKISFAAEVGVEPIKILHPVAMISIWSIGDNW